ncbi:hypothetical protein KORDIASMS9_03822 [Kordia sp. SMS9]|uniref:hypothetical protein n=1 Tax=Kordia sp. SMS9 TaxID=2282170 RepID=UPI000E0D3D13|nr:hypothetical protein [Kordia sp. SMS9]AXG71565.1 hypothetical protein KORDIASMS9_03822 [Kordia sp. SMS9]
MRFLKIDKKYFYWFVLAFFISTIVGTQTHELGHIAMAEALGYETTLNYGSMTYNFEGFSEDEDVIAWRKIFENVESFDDFSEIKKEEADQLFKKIEEKFPSNPTDDFYITLGGPIQTILTSFFGLFILAYRNVNKQENFKLTDWLAVFLSLFILREVFNTVMAGGTYLLKGSTFFSGDEFRISTYLGLNQWTIPIMTAILGAIIASFVIFMIVPKKYRITFILAGFVGSIVGFILWFEFLGPWLF